MPNMPEGKEEAPNSGEPVCVLCRRAQVNPDICGQMFVSGGLCAHEFCLFFANGLLEWRCPVGGIFGFPIGAIQHTIQVASQKHCFVCGKRGAAISCAETGCERSFHLPCAEDGECVTQYFGRHRSFCWEHRPRQAAEAAPSQNTICVICLEPVGDSTSYHTMVCPVCKQAWFHRGCIRKHALHAATMRFFCPVCGGKTRFRSQMTTLGIQIPVRRPSWWDDAAYQLLRERHSRCDATKCLYLRGRETAQEKGFWQLFICNSCGSQGTHWSCSFWAIDRNGWECDTCAGAGTASCTNSEFASPSTSSQEVPVPSPVFTGPENISSGPATQAASSSSCNTQLPELSAQPLVLETEQTTHSHPPEERDTSQQRRGRGGRRGAPAAGAETCSQSPTRRGTARSSRTSHAPAATNRPRQRETGRTRSRSPLRGRASGSQRRPRRQRGGSRATPRGAQSSTRTSARPTPSRSSRASPLPARRRQQSRQRGRAHTRSRSPVGRRASTSRSRPRRGRGSRSRQRGPARARSRSRANHQRRRPHSQSRRRR